MLRARRARACTRLFSDAGKATRQRTRHRAAPATRVNVATTTRPRIAAGRGGTAMLATADRSHPPARARIDVSLAWRVAGGRVGAWARGRGARGAWRGASGAWRGALHDGAMRQAGAVLPSRPRAQKVKVVAPKTGEPRVRRV